MGGKLNIIQSKNYSLNTFFENYHSPQSSYLVDDPYDLHDFLHYYYLRCTVHCLRSRSKNLTSSCTVHRHRWLPGTSRCLSRCRCHTYRSHSPRSRSSRWFLSGLLYSHALPWCCRGLGCFVCRWWFCNSGAFWILFLYCRLIPKHLWLNYIVMDGFN